MPRIIKLLAQGPRIAYIAATDGRCGGAMAVGDGIDGVGAKQMYLDIKPVFTISNDRLDGPLAALRR